MCGAVRKELRRERSLDSVPGAREFLEKRRAEREVSDIVEHAMSVSRRKRPMGSRNA